MGGLARRIPLTFATFAIATAAIAGIPPLAGFFSKDEILWYAFASTRGGSPLLWLVAAATALMTAFYMFRLLWLTFFGRSRMTPEVEHHVHESPSSMTGVLVAAGGAVGARRLHRRAALPRAAAAAAAGRRAPACLRDAAARRLGGARARRPRGGRVAVRRAAPSAPSGCARRFAGLHRWLSGKYFVDELYERLHRPAAGLDLRPRLPALRRPRPDRRHAARPRRARPRQRGGVRSRCRPAACISTRWFVLARHRRRAALELARMSDAALLNVVLFLPLLGIGAARRLLRAERRSSCAAWRSP